MKRNKLPLHRSTVSLPLALISACLLSCVTATASKATGFLDIDNGWTGAAACSDSMTLGCVENLSANSVSLIGFDQTSSQLTFTSQTVPPGSPGYDNISFSYSFIAGAEQTAFYTFGGIQTPLNSTGGNDSIVTIPGTLGPGESIGFGVANGASDFFAQLDITSFSYTGVPAPLPLLGAGAAFGWIRRRRETLRARQKRKLPQS